MKTQYEEYVKDGEGYLRAAVNGQKRPEIFTPEIIYNILAMAIEKFVMATLISRKMMADNHTFIDLIGAAAQISPFSDELVKALKDLQVYQEICPVFEGYNRDPFPPEKIPYMIDITKKVEEWMNSNMDKGES